jgi:SCP-2 sterol transfer family
MSPVGKKTPARKQIATGNGSRRGRRSADPTAEFFDDLQARGDDPLVRRASGTTRFDIVNGSRTERWLLTVKKGKLEVSRKNARADVVVHASRPVFDRLAAGKQNTLAALIRGEVTAQGDPKLLVLVQRLFPRPSRRRARRPASSSARRKQ